MSKNQFLLKKLVFLLSTIKNLVHVCSTHTLLKLAVAITGFVAWKQQTKNRRIVKCHPYLWLAPHLPLVPCLNPRSACYIYIVMRAFLLTKHFLFDCTHKKCLQIALGKFLRKIPTNICRLSVMSFMFFTSNRRDFSPSIFCLFFLVVFASRSWNFFPDLSILDVRKFMTKITGIIWRK